MSAGLWAGISLIVIGIIMVVVAAIFAIVRKDMAWWVWLIGIIGFILILAGIVFLIAGHYSLQSTTKVQ